MVYLEQHDDMVDFPQVKRPDLLVGLQQILHAGGILAWLQILEV